MTHLRNVQRSGAVPRSRVEEAVAQQVGAPTGPRRVVRQVHAVACDCQDCGSATHHDDVLQPDGTWKTVRHACTHEYHAEPVPDYEWYVPLGWGIYANGTHRCPDCRTKAAVEADHKEQFDMQRQFERQYGDGCVNCGKTWNEHHHPELRHPDACELHVHGRQLARPLYKIRQHEHGLKDWTEDVGHLGKTFGAGKG